MNDVIIIGAGPAGLTAGIYLARASKKVLILEKETIGGQMASSPLIENYPGFKAISGSELALNMFNQAVDAGCQIEIEEVTKIEKDKVITEDNEYKAKVIIIATGAKYRKLGLENEENLIGNGIHFCTLCDGAFYKDKVVAVIGGGKTATINALYLSEICKKVYIICRDNKLNCEQVIKDRIDNKDNIEIIYNTNVTKLNGKDRLESITIKTNDQEKDLVLDGIFEAIGMEAATTVAKDLLDLNERNYFKHNNTETKYDNIYVIGDCIDKEIRQITTATSDGSTAAMKVIEYLNKGD